MLDSPGTATDYAPGVTLVSQAGAPGYGAKANVITTATQNIKVENKAIQELFDPNYGRMNATLGIEVPFTSAVVQTTIPLGYADATTETLKPGEVQIWKVTHNGVDTHPVHFHLVNVQLVNRVDWANVNLGVRPEELGWKDTVKFNQLEDVIVAVKSEDPADAVRRAVQHPAAGAVGAGGLDRGHHADQRDRPEQPEHPDRPADGGAQRPDQLRLGVRLALPHPRA